MRYSFILLLGVFLLACEENSLVFAETITESAPFSLTITASGATIEDHTATHRVGPQTDETYKYLHNGCSVSEGLGNTLIVGMADDGTLLIEESNLISEIIRLQFWSDQFPNRGYPNDTTVNSLFAEGTTYQFGRGQGFVNIGYMLPGRNIVDRLSMANHLNDPLGELVIVSLEPYQYASSFLADFSYTIRGYKVTCQFSGEIGVFDAEAFFADQADFLTYRATERAVIRGEFEFFIEVD